MLVVVTNSGVHLHQVSNLHGSDSDEETHLPTACLLMSLPVSLELLRLSTTPPRNPHTYTHKLSSHGNLVGGGAPSCYHSWFILQIAPWFRGFLYISHFRNTKLRPQAWGLVIYPTERVSILRSCSQVSGEWSMRWTGSIGSNVEVVWDHSGEEGAEPEGKILSSPWNLGSNQKDEIVDISIKH